MLFQTFMHFHRFNFLDSFSFFFFHFSIIFSPVIIQCSLIVMHTQAMRQSLSFAPHAVHFSVLQEPVKLRLKLAVHNLSKIMRLNCSKVLLELVWCRQFRSQTIYKTTLGVLLHPRWPLLHISVFIEKYINNHKQNCQPNIQFHKGATNS